MSYPIHVALSANKSYTIPLALCLYSMRQSAAPGTVYHFHILDSGIDRTLIERGNFEHVSWYNVENDLANLPSTLRYPASIYHRYLLPKLLPDTIDRVLYLDCDTYVQRDLSELYNMNLENNPLAAPPWLVMGTNRPQYESYLKSFPERFNLSDDSLPYFFSSQLLMDLKELRAIDATEKLIAMTHRYAKKLIYPDQDVINAFFRNKITPIGQQYNVIPAFATEKELENPEISQAYTSPSIIHFASMKPNILTGPRNSYEDTFFRFWRTSPWKNHIPYPLISLVQFPKAAAKLLNALIRMLLPYPCMLKTLGAILNSVRKIIR
ncbi:MAG: glycosyltransferase family 8 protein [Akkermansia sp.]|nr:glycosyltransferase family 8 protein [Akkermansia sp.]MBR6576824.1 glycosyltransferase family 8 protein [Akkermansia sp.]